jgi:hypothetical protein
VAKTGPDFGSFRELRTAHAAAAGGERFGSGAIGWGIETPAMPNFQASPNIRKRRWQTKKEVESCAGSPFASGQNIAQQKFRQAPA